MLEITKHVKVWISYAKFEQDHSLDFAESRRIFEEAYIHFKDNEADLKEERVMILETWLQLENSTAANKAGPRSEQAKYVQAKMPKKVKKRRKILTQQSDLSGRADDDEEGWEEYYDYVFPDDEAE